MNITRVTGTRPAIGDLKANLEDSPSLFTHAKMSTRLMYFWKPAYNLQKKLFYSFQSFTVNAFIQRVKIRALLSDFSYFPPIIVYWKSMLVPSLRGRTWSRGRIYSKSSLTLNEWRFNLSFPWVSMLFLNSWWVRAVPYYVTTHSPAIQKQHWH
jgi:hypothetical protein